MTAKVLPPHNDHVPQGLSVLDAVIKRKSIRRFLSTPVSSATVRAILDGAARAPSGTNIQPWKVHVVTGAARERLSQAVLEAARAGRRSDEYAYIPSPLKEPYLSRRRRIGFELYRLYGIEKTDVEGRKQAMLRNFEFFGAPVGLFFAMERYLLEGSWLDCGMFMQNVMILAREYGLETCPQQAWCEYGGVVHKELGLSDHYIMLSGMALGYQAPDAPENSLESERLPLEEFVEFHLA
ncbi:nitroreductase [Bradyrhizobium sp. 190]|uniref:nitroreductase n=1 Tax=Bradyrhizobium sp. 190 TaxID=2782658 RepID=UPI001FFC09BC|nr:nitroreductase [Bradyrhizobium sp. 190]MCK1515034.1 nitroreductase [Bradyrhizobium sp. 190]